MPRVTYATYRNRHLILRQLWAEEQWIFSLISPGEQWALHDYYLCATPMTEETLRQHYQDIRASGSSLPQRAGKAFARLGRRILSRQVASQNTRAPRRHRHIAVSVIVNPEPDLRKLVRALILFVRQQEMAASPDAPTDDGA